MSTLNESHHFQWNQGPLLENLMLLFIIFFKLQAIISHNYEENNIKTCKIIWICQHMLHVLGFVSAFQRLMLLDNGPVKVRVFIGPSFILSDLTENPTLIAQSELLLLLYLFVFLKLPPWVFVSYDISVSIMCITVNIVWIILSPLNSYLNSYFNILIL